MKVFARKFGVRQWSLIGPGSEKKRYSAENSPHGAWDHIADEMRNSQKADILLSVQRLHCPGVFLEAKDVESCQYTSLQIIQLLKQFFRFIISVNQLSIYGAVAAIRDEYEGHQDRSGEPVILVGQSMFSVKLRHKFLCRTKTL